MKTGIHKQFFDKQCVEVPSASYHKRFEVFCLVGFVLFVFQKSIYF